MDTVPLFFYASRFIAQDICSSRSLRAGPSGFIHFSSESWESGAQAAASLSVKDHPVEVRCVVEVERTKLLGPKPARPIRGPDGTILRVGGGREFRYKGPRLSLERVPEWKHLGIP